MCSYNLDRYFMWIQVDLGSKRTIGEINLIGRNTNDCSCAASQSTGWILKIGNTGNINVVDSFETKRGDCIQYATDTTTCTQYRNTQCSLHVTEEENAGMRALHGGPSNVDDNLGFGGVVYRLDRPFGCYHDVTGENKYYLNLKVLLCYAQKTITASAKLLALVTLTLHMHMTLMLHGQTMEMKVRVCVSQVWKVNIYQYFHQMLWCFVKSKFLKILRQI